MNSDVSVTVRFELPRVDALLDELKLIRDRLGITRDKLVSADNLKNLAVVSNELKGPPRRPEAERHLVAYDVLECVAGRAELFGADYSVVVAMTLNFKHERNGLGDRRRAAIERLRLRPSREASQSSMDTPVTPDDSVYKTLEARAYEAFASVLVRIRESPCGSGGPAYDARLAKLEDQVAVLLLDRQRLTDLSERLAGALRDIVSAFSTEEQDAGMRALIRALPRLQTHAYQTLHIKEPREILRRVLPDVILGWWTPWERRATFDVHGDETLVWGALTDDRTWAFLERVLESRPHGFDKAVAEFLRRLELTDDDLIDGTSEQIELQLRAALALLPYVIAAMEIADEWKSIGGDQEEA